jgi:hypothetical protein
MDDSNLREQGQGDDNTGAGVDAPVENQAIDQEYSIIDETMNLSTVRDRTQSKSKQYNILQPVYPSESEQPRPSRSKRAQRGAS